MRHSISVTLIIFLATVLALSTLFVAHSGTSEAKPSKSKTSGVFKGLRTPPTQTGSSEDLRKTDRIDVLKEDFKSYSQVVDNVSSKRIKAPGWTKKASKPGGYGKDYRVSESGKKAQAARYKVKVPADGVYSVFAWWPKGLNEKASARFGISTIEGVKWSTVDQSRDGGYWVPIGEYRMEKGERYGIRVLPNSSEPVVIDAVSVVRGVLDFPPDPPKKKGKKEGKAEVASGGMIFDTASDEESSLEDEFTGVSFAQVAATSTRITPRAITRRAVSHIGTPYGNNRCRRTVQEDCSCFTRLVFNKWKRLPDSPKWQWNYGRRIARSNTSRGDLVFFDINRDGVLGHWDHVGIYLGNGYIIHANSYYKYRKVHRQQMRWLPGYWGTKRLR
jgi:cell wall-associated NlpC family hydrolase